MLDETAVATLESVVGRLADALATGDADAAAALFREDGYWRDIVAFTWNIRTMEGREAIRAMLGSQLPAIAPQGLALDPRETAEAGEQGSIEGWITFETATGRGTGHVRVKDGLIWTLLTCLTELAGFEEPTGPRRPMGAEHGYGQKRATWKEQRAAEAAALGTTTQPYALIVGGGQGGIALGARLRQLGVPAIVVDRHERPGDQWRGRYKSLCLHDPVWFDHLPYIPFPENWPVFSPKDKIADWLEWYATVMELTYWGSTTARKAVWDAAAGEWVVTLDRAGEEVVLRPRQLVLATGMSGKPNVPALPGQDVFRGEQHHSSAHPGPDAYAGRKVVVIGSNNSAHDICAALWENGADVTMVQRSSTHVVRSESLMELGLGPHYSEDATARGISTEKADMLGASVPYRIMHEFQMPIYEKIRRRDADFYRRLEGAGFLHDWGADGSGLHMKYMRRGSGYYIDVGASDLVIDGSIRLVPGRQVERLSETGVVLDDGTELPADLVVYATGYGSMNGWAADLVSQEAADRVGKVWGLGSGTPKDPGPWEGEPRNMWKPTRVDALWFHGGNLAQSRFYSRALALQLKARMEGLPVEVYGLQETHHTS